MILKTLDNNWVTCLQNNTHNHEATNPIAYSTHQRLGAAALQQIDQQSQANVTPRQILSSLCVTKHSVLGHANALSIARDVYNARAKIRNNWLGPPSPVQAAIAMLEESSWHH